MATNPAAAILLAGPGDSGFWGATMAAASGREELELTGEEAERLARAFQDEGFRQLFAEYAAELADPAQRALYEAEVAALERERGVEARFLHPKPGWVLRTSQDGARRCYLNLCSNALVGRPQARPEPGGSAWSLPHCLSPGREELGRRRHRRRLVYDVLFHPETLRLAARSPRFRRLVEATALEAVEKHFAPGLDRANATALRGVRYKGLPQASLLRTPLPGGPPPPAPSEEEGQDLPSPLPPFPTPYSYPPPEPEIQSGPPSPPPPPAAAATPRWTLRHRSFVDLQDYRQSRDSAPSPVPRELEVSVELPLLRSAAQAQLEVVGRELQLDSPPPAAYRLRLPLPYAVDEARAKALFDKAKRRLVVTLPVLAAKPQQSPAGSREKERREASASMAAGEGEPLPAAHVCSSPASKDSHLPALPGPDPPPPLPPVSPVGLPTCAEEADPLVPDVAAAAAESTQEGSPPETPTSTIPGWSVGQEEALPVSLLPSSSAGSTLEQPPSRRSIITPVGQPHPSKADMDHPHQSPEADPLLSPPCAHVSPNNISQPSESPLARSDCPNLSQGTELSTNAHSHMPPLHSQSQADVVAPALCPRSGMSSSAPPPLPSSAGADAPPLPPVSHVGLPTRAKEVDLLVPEAAAAAAEFTQERSPLETAICTISDLPVGQEETLSLSLQPSFCAGNILEQPGTPGKSSIPTESQPHPSKTDMDHHRQSPEVDPLLSLPCTHLSSNIISQPSESPLASNDCPSIGHGTELSMKACSQTPPPCPQTQADIVPSALCPRSGAFSSPPPLPSLAGKDAPPTLSSCPDSSVSPASPALLQCPPFHCTQDEKVLTLLLQVPGVVPQSIKGEVGTNQYKVSFDNKDSASYTILLRFLPENKLTPPESEVSVSPNNVIVILAKSPEATGLWTKMYFGPNVNMLQVFLHEVSSEQTPPPPVESLSEYCSGLEFAFHVIPEMERHIKSGPTSFASQMSSLFSSAPRR
ncbi:hypothetical protein JD844_020252 [Phrynosoma platyrhinos]|uniref:Protein kintoun n=1 Tax=Phrynosoma platyrhinos TaxID=52577 RepID=A0ABQ7SSE8_PHRPL|nr:hypothetical protein JD844_020252 [Phrynosoma platyrhinos]